MLKSYQMSDSQLALREELHVILAMLNIIQVKNIESGQIMKISELLKSRTMIPFSDLVFEVVFLA